MMDFMDRIRNVKETIMGTISDYISHDILLQIMTKHLRVDRSTTSPFITRIDSFHRQILLINRGMIRFRRTNRERSFNKQRFELLSSSERLLISESILKELE